VFQLYVKSVIGVHKDAKSEFLRPLDFVMAQLYFHYDSWYPARTSQATLTISVPVKYLQKEDESITRTTTQYHEPLAKYRNPQDHGLRHP
jgi:hypothetical protein